MGMKFINEDTGVLKDAIFCFTGKSPKTHPEMEAMAIKAMARVTKYVSSRTTILVIADANSMSSKAKKARLNGIDLISPKQFFKMCSSSPFSVDPLQHNDNVKISKPNPISKPSGKRRHSSVRRIEL